MVNDADDRRCCPCPGIDADGRKCPWPWHRWIGESPEEMEKNVQDRNGEKEQSNEVEASE